MDAFGINWFLLLFQLVFCLAIPVGIVFLFLIIRNRKSSKSFVAYIGFLTALITVLSIVFILVWVITFVLNIINPSAGFEIGWNFYSSNPVQILGMVTILGMVVLLAYYIPHVGRSPFIPDGDRVYYQIAFFFLPFIMMPMYYLKYIKNEPSTAQKA